MRKSLFYYAVLAFSSSAILSSCWKKPDTSTQSHINCRPPVNASMNQFIIGYGSLMQEQSKREDDPHAGNNFPIILKGFERGWIEPDYDNRFRTTYLGVKPHPGYQINAVYFKISNSDSMAQYDKRENTYCRVRVLPQQITALSATRLPQGQYWIYIPQRVQNHIPSRELPLVQSYVDIFLSGCLQLEAKYHLKDFSKTCIKTTSHWSKFWVNDRQNPRVTSEYINEVNKVSPLLAKELPHYYKHIPTH